MIVPPAFRSKNFRLYWIGHLISIAGSQMQLWSIYWHLRTLSDQPVIISGIGLARFLPIIFLSLIAGVVADRYDRRKLTILTQLALGMVATVLGIMTFRENVTIWLIFGLMIVQSIAVAFDVPARQALIPSLVPREDLPSAYSLNSIASKVGGILGPGISGIVIAYLGLEWAYWINAISYIAVIIALLAMGNISSVKQVRTYSLQTTFGDIKAGISFIKNSPVILSAMILDFFGTFFSSANTLLPFVARDILHVGPIQYGWLSASQSIGTLMIGIYVSQKRNLYKQGMTIAISIILFGLATILFGLSTSFWLTMAALILIGVFDGLSSIIRNILRQVLTPDEMRGRMMSITQIFFKGGPQLGEVESGIIAQLFSPPVAIITGGIGCVIASLLVLRKYPQLWHYNGDEQIAVKPSAVTIL
jgi:MFS family permease